MEAEEYLTLGPSTTGPSPHWKAMRGWFPIPECPSLPQFACHTLVLGGTAGVATAALLAQRFARTPLVERAPSSEGPAVRVQTPLGAHLHLLVAGRPLTLTRLFSSLP